MTETSNPDAWERPQNILVVLAHPDDPNSFAARRSHAGHAPDTTSLLPAHLRRQRLQRYYAGRYDTDMLCSIRHEEQANAAKVIGAQAVTGWTVPTVTSSRTLTCAATFCAPSAAQAGHVRDLRSANLFAGYGINHPITALPDRPRWMLSFPRRETERISRTFGRRPWTAQGQ